jgi:hypothetical protein
MRAISFIVFTVTLLLAMVVGDQGISHALTAMLNEHPFEAMLVGAVIIEPLVVGTKNAWKMLGISPAYGWELIKAGELESFFDGRMRKIVVASIHAYIQRKMTESKKAAGGPVRTAKATTQSMANRAERKATEAAEDGASPPHDTAGKPKPRRGRKVVPEVDGTAVNPTMAPTSTSQG